MFQIPSHLVATEVPDHQASRTDDDHIYLDIRHRRDISLALLLRLGRLVRGQSQCAPLRRRLAQSPKRSPVLCHWQSDLLLYSPNGTHHHVLHPHLDQSLETLHTFRHPGRPNGENATKI